MNKFLSIIFALMCSVSFAGDCFGSTASEDSDVGSYCCGARKYCCKIDKNSYTCNDFYENCDDVADDSYCCPD